MPDITLKVENSQQSDKIRLSGTLFVGRALPRELAPQFNVADEYLSRQQFRLVEIADGLIQLTNLGSDILLAEQTLSKEDSVDLNLPVTFHAGRTQFQLGVSEQDNHQAMQTLTPQSLLEMHDSSWQFPNEDSSQSSKFTLWLESVLNLQGLANSTDQFHQATTEAVVRMIGLDHAWLLQKGKNEQWQVTTEFSNELNSPAQISSTIIRQVEQQKLTVYELTAELTSQASLVDTCAVVASPILDRDQNVTQILYGTRYKFNQGREGITELEARLVQLLASTVSTGNRRLKNQLEQQKLRSQLEAFASPAIVKQLEINPELLKGEEREISCLFADLRKFTTICERLGTSRGYDLLSQLMEELTNAVYAEDGVVFHYAGDGMGAMWNAPIDQPDHAARACRCAINMQDLMMTLSQEWKNELGQPLQLGIGIHTGLALVGNTGSSKLINYGPQGHTVNLASRLEGATKQLGVDTLISDVTTQQLTQNFETLKLVPIKPIGLQQSTLVHQLARHLEPEEPAVLIMNCFETNDLRGAEVIFEDWSSRPAKVENQKQTFFMNLLKQWREQGDRPSQYELRLK